MPLGFITTVKKFCKYIDVENFSIFLKCYINEKFELKIIAKTDNFYLWKCSFAVATLWQPRQPSALVKILKLTQKNER